MDERKSLPLASGGEIARNVEKQAEQVRESAAQIEASAGAVERSTDQLTDSADRRTVAPGWIWALRAVSLHATLATH